MKILIVEDDQASFAYLKKIIQTHHRCEVILAENGLEALKKVENTEFDGIISDVSMPMMSGLELLEILVSNDDTKNIPIMMTSANNTRIDVEEALQLGATDYLLKPLMIHETLARINRFIDIIKSKSDEIINRTTNIELKNVVIISSTPEDWEKVIKNYETNFQFKLFSSAPDGLEYYMKYFPAIVVLDRNLKTITDELIAKKIKRMVQEKALRNVKIITTIIGLNKDLNSELFDHVIDAPNKLPDLLLHEEQVSA